MARGIVGLMARRFGTPRAAAMVLVVLTGLAAFCIAAGPSAFITLTRVEAGYQVESVHHAARNLGAAAEGPAPSLGPSKGAPDPRIATGAVNNFGALYDELAAIHDAWPALARTIIMPGSVALQSGNFSANPVDLDIRDFRTEIRFTVDPEWEQRTRLVEGRRPMPLDAVRIVQGDPEWTPELEIDSANNPNNWILEYQRWRTQIEIVLVKSVADRVNWAVGESRPVPLIGNLAEDLTIPDAVVTLVGVVELIDPTETAWWEIPRVNPTEMLSDNRTIVTAAFVAPELAGRVDNGPSVGMHALYTWFPVTAEPVPGLDTEQLLIDIRQVLAEPISLGGVQLQLGSLTATALADSLDRIDSTAAVLGIAVSGPVAVALALIAVASGLILRRRASADRLLSGRGLSLGRMRLLLALEGLLLGLPIALVAVVIARLVTVEDAGWIPDAIGMAVGFTPALGLLTAAADPLARGARETDLGVTPSTRTWLRVAAELVVWALAIGAGALMVMRGDAAGANPLVVLAPVLVAAAVGLLAVRIYPFAIRRILSATGRWKGAVGLVGAARTLRDPIVGGVAILAVIVVIATVAFSATMLTTMQRGADSAGAQAAGADLRVTGPTFNETMIEAVKAVPGVADVTTIANVNAVSVNGAGSMNISLVVLDPRSLAAIQAGLIGGFDGENPPELGNDPSVELLLGPGLAAKFGSASLSIRGVPVKPVGSVRTVLGMTLAGDWAVISPEGYKRIFGALAPARNLLVRLTEEVRDAGNSAAPQDAGGEQVATVMAEVSSATDNSHTISNYWQHRARIAGSPAVISLKTSLLVALTISVLLAAVAFMLLAGVTRENRARTTALLSTLGADQRQQTGIVAWEFVPIALAGVVWGGVLGAFIPWLAVTGVNLRPFTAGRAQPGLSVDPLLISAMGASALAAICVVILIEVWRARRVPIVDVLRSEEHG